MSKLIHVFADWVGLDGPIHVGNLRYENAKGKENFSFEYSNEWLKNENFKSIDPELNLYKGTQFAGSNNFRIFTDSCPDRWGQRLMHKMEAQLARQEQRVQKKLSQLDILLRVDDFARMGALRFKENMEGDFLAPTSNKSTPPIRNIRDLEEAAWKFEKDSSSILEDMWLETLIGAGSPLGGARPKSVVVDNDDSLWLAKFPKPGDDIDNALWEYLAYQIATEELPKLNVGIRMADTRCQKFFGVHNTFLTKRFDRTQSGRIHYSSAMTLLQKNDDEDAAYYEIADFISHVGSNPDSDLRELFIRMVFSIAISNTDDHLRNHGFLFIDNGWQLSPAFDINPSIKKQSLTLDIDENDSSLNYELAIGTSEYYRLTRDQANDIVNRVIRAVSRWKDMATRIGINRAEIERMEPAFNIERVD